MLGVLIESIIDTLFVLVAIGLYIWWIIKKREYIESFFSFRRIMSTLSADIMVRVLVLAVTVFIIALIPETIKPFRDIPCVIDEEYEFVRGYTVVQAKGGRNQDGVKRSLHIENIVTGIREDTIIVYANYIEKGEYLEVKFLPHSRYGIIEKRGK